MHCEVSRKLCTGEHHPHIPQYARICYSKLECAVEDLCTFAKYLYTRCTMSETWSVMGVNYWVTVLDAHTHACTHAHTHTHTHTLTHSHTYTHACMCAHTLTHTNTHTLTSLCVLTLSSLSLSLSLSLCLAFSVSPPPPLSLHFCCCWHALNSLISDFSL